MPYAFENRKLLLPCNLDRRRKLTDEQIEQIFQMKSQGMSQRKIAAAFGVSRNTIRLIVSPSYRESRHRYNSCRWRVYAERYKPIRNDYMTNHRHYKHKLMQEGLLGKNNKEDKQ